jgi:signal transduction histidine kinase
MHQNSSNICKPLEHFLFNTFIHKLKDIIMITDSGSGSGSGSGSDFGHVRILGVNSFFESTTGLTQKQLINSPCAQWINISINQLHRINAALNECRTIELVLAVKNIDGDFIQLQFEIYPVEQATQYWIWQGKPLKLEQSDHYDQTLSHQNEVHTVESVAAQSAHYFNNILAIIMGNNDLILENSEASSPFYPLLQSISRAVEQGTYLTKNLLVFAQKSIVTNENINLNACISSMADGLRKDISSHHTLIFKLTEQPNNIVVDLALLQECISNLVLNAAQAMYEKSTIIIEVNKVFVREQKDAFEQTISPQKYVKLTISDTGKGISKTNLPLIFTPFFTTHKTKAAKGLGLSLVYGFMKKNKGYCLVDTVVDKGSSFSLLFNIKPHHPIL